MPSEQAAKRLPQEALDAFLDGILAELEEPSDPAALKEIRAAFRKRVPFSKRSYAAAALILRAAGLSRAPSRNPAKDQGFAIGSREANREAKRGPKAPRGDAPRDPRPPRPEGPEEGRPPRPRFTGEATTLFCSMGKRQRLYPRILIDLAIDVAGLSPESLGDVRAFDNYSFVDVDPEKAQALISALDGYDFRGRKLSISLAKKKDEASES